MITFNIPSEFQTTLNPLLIQSPIVRVWIERVISSYHAMVGAINYTFCSDERILEVNKQFLHHDYYTDIITFDYSNVNIFVSPAEQPLTGDIFISVETVSSNSQTLGHPFEEELLRVIIHGVLHLLGQEDKTPTTCEQMHHLEDQALTLYNAMI